MKHDEKVLFNYAKVNACFAISKRERARTRTHARTLTHSLTLPPPSLSLSLSPSPVHLSAHVSRRKEMQEAYSTATSLQSLRLQ